MKIQRHQPSSRLAPYINHYWSMTGNLANEFLYTRDIPDGNIEVVINLGTSFLKADSIGKWSHFKHGAIKGPFDQSVIIAQTRIVNIIGISFKPYGLYPFIGSPLYALRNSALPLQKLFLPNLLGQLSEAVKQGIWISWLEERLLQQQKKELFALPLLENSFKELHFATQNNLRKWSQGQGCSLRGLQRIYREVIGLPPKKLFRIIRMHKLINRLQATTEVDWMQLVVDYDFYDRAHLCKEFQQLIGTQPTSFIQRPDTFSSHYQVQA